MSDQQSMRVPVIVERPGAAGRTDAGLADETDIGLQPEPKQRRSPDERADPKVSVVIPTWNGELWIREAIESVLDQSMQDLEIIVCDDASTDRTVSIANEYRGDGRLQVHRFEDNLGLGGNWNRGIRLAGGTCLKVLCQDDRLMAGCLEASVDVLENRPDVMLVTSFGRVFGDVERLRDGSVFPGTGVMDGHRAQRLIVEKENWIGAPTAVMFRREDIDRIGYFDETLPCNLDWEMWLRLLSWGNLYVIPELLHATRFHSGKESMRCLKNLGFEKDRVAILSRLRQGDRRYGEWQMPELKRAWVHSVRSLFRASRDRKSGSLSDVFTFMNQYQSNLQSWMMFLRLQLRESMARLKRRHNPGLKSPGVS